MRVEALDPDPPQLAFGPARAAGGGPRGRGVDGHDVGSEVGHQLREIVDEDPALGLEHAAVGVHQHQVEPLANPDVDAQSSHDRQARERCARNSSRSLRVRAPSAWPALTTSTAAPCCSDSNASSIGASNSTRPSGGPLAPAPSAPRAAGAPEIPSTKAV